MAGVGVAAAEGAEDEGAAGGSVGEPVGEAVVADDPIDESDGSAGVTTLAVLTLLPS